MEPRRIQDEPPTWSETLQALALVAAALAAGILASVLAVVLLVVMS
jgi:hypothetical protein